MNQVIEPNAGYTREANKLAEQTVSGKTILKVEGLKKFFPIKAGVFKRVVGNVKAVNDVSFFLREGETLGLVGESGCGKTTTGRCIPRLIEPTAGSIQYNLGGEMVEITKLDREELKQVRQEIQVIFQDPFSSLNPRMTVGEIIGEPLKVNKVCSASERDERVRELLRRVNLTTDMINRYPHEFSGGQRQRISVARALALNTKVVICDESVSALDVSVQAQILNMLKELQREMGLSYLFIAHDLNVVEHISHRVAVMYLGRIVEMAESGPLYDKPLHPYTEALLSAIPTGDPLLRKKRIHLHGSVPDSSNPPPGCNFHPRCSYATEVCKVETPQLVEMRNQPGRFVACHRTEELRLLGYTELRDRASGE